MVEFSHFFFPKVFLLVLRHFFQIQERFFNGGVELGEDSHVCYDKILILLALDSLYGQKWVILLLPVVFFVIWCRTAHNLLELLYRNDHISVVVNVVYICNKHQVFIILNGRPHIDCVLAPTNKTHNSLFGFKLTRKVKDFKQ